jgi:hypothetical protein
MSNQVAMEIPLKSKTLKTIASEPQLTKALIETYGAALEKKSAYGEGGRVHHAYRAKR